MRLVETMFGRLFCWVILEVRGLLIVREHWNIDAVCNKKSDSCKTDIR
jgi:hypothetical protein